MRRLQFLANIWFIIPGLALMMIACSAGGGRPSLAENIQVTSPAFEEEGPIPATYTCDGENKSPPLKWTGVPEGIKSIALIFDDPDARGGTWVHWVLYAVPPDTTELSEEIPRRDVLADGARHGITDFKQVGYGGPCPPSGDPHRYIFKVYAMDIQVDLAPGATKEELLVAINGHILAQGQLLGTYKRR